MSVIHTDTPDAWRTLFARALLLIDDLKKRTGRMPFWTFGGGTALMLRNEANSQGSLRPLCRHRQIARQTWKRIVIPFEKSRRFSAAAH